MTRLRGLLSQLLLVVVLPVFLALAGVALGSVWVHQNAMRDMVAGHDLHTAHALSQALAERWRTDGPAGDADVRASMEPLQAGAGAVVIVANPAGRVVYRSAAGQIGQAVEQSGVTRALSGQSGTLFTPQGDVLAYTYVEAVGERWALVIEDAWTETSSPWLNVSLLGPLILVPGMALLLLAVWFGVRRVVLPLQKLDAQVTAMGWGDYAALDQAVGGICEIEELQRALRRLAAQVAAAQQSMRGYIGAITQAQEEERKRLARELHDDTLQSLIALKQQSHRIRRSMAREPAQAEAALAELQATITATMDDVRRFSHALRPVYLEEAGLVAALEMLARDAGKLAAVRVNFDLAGDTRRLPDEIELALYRIAQEALTNALKHAQATQLDVRLSFEHEAVTLCVQDNGIGFEQPERVGDLVTAGHYGLMGIHERAQLIGARLTIHSRPGQGTRVELKWTQPPGAGV